jgi:hypothetical protein
MTLQPTNRAPWSAIALIVRSSLARDDVKPGTIGFQLADRAEPLRGVRRARLEPLPRLLVDRRHAHVHRARRHFRQLHQHVAIAHDHRPLRDQPDRVAGPQQRFERPARQPVVTLDRLVAIGGGADGDMLTGP